MGVDISQLAIDRARARNLPYASFVVADFLDVSLAGFDVITAIECLYYLADSEQDLLLAKLAREHRGPFILSCPIVGDTQHGRYFTHDGLMARLAAHGEFHNVSLYRPDGFSRIAAGLFVRLPTWQPSCARLLAEPAYLPAPLHREVLGATRRP